jgi:4-amino-4-deoxy-L-arabinose transferase-like glycosyltransferase
VLIRLTGPSDLLDNDQLGPAAYANDALVNGHWIVQTDVGANIASKPPLTTWLIALLSLPEGHATRLTLAIPSALSVLGCALLAYFFGRRHFGMVVGVSAALAVLLCPMGAKQVTLVRTDAMYAFVVGIATLLAWHAWRRGSGWILFWLAAAAVTLTKGPVGLLVPLGGMLAALWERRAPDRRAPARPRRLVLTDHAIGIALFLFIAGGWFALAWMHAGEPFIDKILGRELIGKMAHSGAGDLPFTGFYNPPLYYLSRFAPASVFTFIALWRTWRRPSAEPEARALERYLTCGFLLTMLVFCIAPHQRADHLTPLWVSGALLAGREIAALARAMSPRGCRVALSLWVVAALGAIIVDYAVLAAHHPVAIRAQGLRHLAGEIRAIPNRPPLLHVRDNSALQFYLATMNHRVSPEAAADALAASEPVLVATSADDAELDAALAGRGVHATVLMSWTDAKGWGVRILANEAAAKAISR